MATQGGKHRFRCPCYDDQTKYHKIVDLKDTGLVIYRKAMPDETDTTKQDLKQATISPTVSNEDIFILHNTKDVEISSADIIPAFDENKINCPRCRRIFENAQRLLQTIPKINKNDIMGICDHCRRKITRSPCEKCDEVVRKFVSSRDEVEDTKKHIKEWLSKIHQLLKDVVIGEKNIFKPKSRASSRIDLSKMHHNSPVSLREPEVTDLFYSENLRTGSTKTLHISDQSYSLPGFSKIRKKTKFVDYLDSEKSHFVSIKHKRFYSKSYEDLAYPVDDTISSPDLRRDDYSERRLITDRTLKKMYMRADSDMTPGKYYSEDSLIPIRKHRYPSEETLKPHEKHSPGMRPIAQQKDKLYEKRMFEERLITHRKYSSEEIPPSYDRHFREDKSLAPKEQLRPYEKYTSDERLLPYAKYTSEGKITAHRKHTLEESTRLHRKHKSEETIKTSISGVIEDHLKQDFGYFFPHSVDDKIKPPKKRISSSQLIKDTTDMLKARAEEERLKREEEQRKKKEEQERRAREREQRRLLREEAKKKAEEARRLAEEAKRLADEEERRLKEIKRLAEEEAKRLAEEERKRLAEEQKRLSKSKKQPKTEPVKKAKEPPPERKRKEPSEPVEKSKVKEPSPIKTKVKEPPPEKPKKEPLPEKPKAPKPLPESKVVKSTPEKPKPKELPQEKTIIKEPPPEQPHVTESLPEKTKVQEPIPEKPKVIEPVPEKPKQPSPIPEQKEKPKKEKPEPIVKEKEEVKAPEKPKPEPKPEPVMADDFKKLLEEQAQMKEERQRLKKQKEEEDRKAREEAEKKMKEMEQQAKSAATKAKKEAEKPKDEEKPREKKQEPTTMKELNIKQIKVREPSVDDLILKLVKLKQANRSDKTKMAKDVNIKNLIFKHKGHKNIKDAHCVVCTKSDIELDLESIQNQTDEVKMADIIIGPKIFRYKTPIPLADINQQQNEIKNPIIFKTDYNEDTDVVKEKIEEIPKVISDEAQQKSPPLGPAKATATKGKQPVEQEVPKGIVRYALSDRSFIDKGWTMLPTEKVVRKMNVYRMRPAQPEFDWFEHNKNKRLMTYDTGERLAEFDDNGRGRWYYKNGRLALDYYDAEEINAQQRFVVYSSGEPDERGRSRPFTILATFDYLGNGIVFDHSGKIRLKYNQTEGVVLDRAIGPVSHWKWHTLNDPPVLQQVMIDTQMPLKDPDIIKLGGPGDNKARPDNEEMLAIEFDNFIKEKSKKLTQKFKPFQIKMKALKINESFSLKVLDQATVYLIFREGSANLKLNIGMILDHKEIVDTDTAEVGEVSNSLERLPARTDSIAGLQRSVAHAQRVERLRVERERRLRPPEPCGSADRLTAAAARPLRPPFRADPEPSSTASPSTTTTYGACKCRKPSSSNLYYDTRLF